MLTMRKVLLLLVLAGVVASSTAAKVKPPKCPEKGEPKHMNLRGCCGSMDDLFPSSSETKCKENMPKEWDSNGPKGSQRERGKLDCFIDCLFTENGYKKNGAIKMDKVPEAFKDAFEKCMNELPSHPPASGRRNDKKCDRMASDVTMCVQKEVAVNCPESDWNSEEPRCNSARMKFKSCPKTAKKATTTTTITTTTTTTTTTPKPSTTSSTTTTAATPVAAEAEEGTKIEPKLGEDSPKEEESTMTPEETTEMNMSSSTEAEEVPSSSEATTSSTTTTPRTTTTKTTTTTTPAPSTEAPKRERGQRRRGDRRRI